MTVSMTGGFDDYKKHLQNQVNFFQNILNAVTEVEGEYLAAMQENEELKLQIETYRKREAMRLAANNKDLAELPEAQTQKIEPRYLSTWVAINGSGPVFAFQGQSLAVSEISIHAQAPEPSGGVSFMGKQIDPEYIYKSDRHGNEADAEEEAKRQNQLDSKSESDQ